MIMITIPTWITNLSISTWNSSQRVLLKTLISMECLKIWLTLKMNKSLFYIRVLTTQQVKIQPETSGKRFLKLSKLKVILLPLIVLIKDSQVETSMKMLTPLDILLTIPIDSVSFNLSQRISDFTERELETSTLFAKTKLKPTSLTLDWSNLLDQCTLTHQSTVLESSTWSSEIKNIQ